MPGRLAIVLPPREGFSPDACGAIGLCVRDFTHASRCREDITVFGGAPQGFSGIRYRKVEPAGFGSRRRRYLTGLRRAFRSDPPRGIEVQNRPALAFSLSRDWPVALHLHNDPQEMESARTARERKKLLARLGRVFCVSEFIRARFLEGVQGDPGKVVVVPNGLALPPTIDAREKEIVFCGRLAATKGAHEFAAAMEIALPRCPGWKAVVIGADRHDPAGGTTPYETATRAILDRLVAASRAEMTGYLPHEAAMARLSRAGVAVVPSIWPEPFGRSALEAMAYGAALVTSGRGGLTEVVGDAGLIVEPAPEAMAEAIVMLCADEVRRDRLAAAGRQRAARFEIGAMTARLDAARTAWLPQ